MGNFFQEREPKESLPIFLSIVIVAVLRLDELVHVGQPEPDAVVALAGPDDGQLLAVRKNQLVVDERLTTSYGQLLLAEAELQQLTFVPAHLEG